MCHLLLVLVLLCNIRKCTLSFIETDTAKNVVGAAVSLPLWVERTFEICSPCLYGCLTSICHQLL